MIKQSKIENIIFKDLENEIIFMKDIKFIQKIISKKKILINEKKISLNSNRIYYKWLKSQKEYKIIKIEKISY